MSREAERERECVCERESLPKRCTRKDLPVERETELFRKGVFGKIFWSKDGERKRKNLPKIRTGMRFPKIPRCEGKNESSRTNAAHHPSLAKSTLCFTVKYWVA